MKTAGNSWVQKERLEDHMVQFIDIEILLRKDQSKNQSKIYDGGFPRKYLTFRSH